MIMLWRCREGVALLRTEDGQVAGHLAAIVDEFWSPGRPLTWQERVWWLVTWSDGRRDRIEEDSVIAPSSR